MRALKSNARRTSYVRKVNVSISVRRQLVPRVKRVTQVQDSAHLFVMSSPVWRQSAVNPSLVNVFRDVRGLSVKRGSSVRLQRVNVLSYATESSVQQDSFASLLLGPVSTSALMLNAQRVGLAKQASVLLMLLVVAKSVWALTHVTIRLSNVSLIAVVTTDLNSVLRTISL